MFLNAWHSKNSFPRDFTWIKHISMQQLNLSQLIPSSTVSIFWTRPIALTPSFKSYSRKNGDTFRVQFEPLSFPSTRKLENKSLQRQSLAK